jgi:hypothetical protein
MSKQPIILQPLQKKPGMFLSKQMPLWRQRGLRKMQPSRRSNVQKKLMPLPIFVPDSGQAKPARSVYRR